jgi:chloramphenicol 3-O-phosphotransferase
MFCMGENVENMVLEYLRRLDMKVNALDIKMDALTDDLRETRSVLSGVVQILASQDAHMLRVETRLGRIEKRLQLHDPAISG